MAGVLRARTPPRLGARPDGLGRLSGCGGRLRPDGFSKTREWLGAVTESSAIGTPVPAAFRRIPAAFIGAAGRGVLRCALSVDLRIDTFPDPGDADRGVQESPVAVLFGRCARADIRMQVWGVPPTVRCEPPSVALEVLAQNTPSLSRHVSNRA